MQSGKHRQNVVEQHRFVHQKLEDTPCTERNVNRYDGTILVWSVKYGASDNLPCMERYQQILPNITTSATKPCVTVERHWPGHLSTGDGRPWKMSQVLATKPWVTVEQHWSGHLFTGDGRPWKMPQVLTTKPRVTVERHWPGHLFTGDGRPWKMPQVLATKPRVTVEHWPDHLFTGDGRP